MMSVNKGRIVVDACNVHLGGGYTLLSALLDGLERQDRDAVVFLDSRLRSKIEGRRGVVYRFIDANVISRIKHYITLSNFCREGDVVFCFGNIPPFFKLHEVEDVFVFAKLVFNLRSPVSQS